MHTTETSDISSKGSFSKGVTFSDFLVNSKELQLGVGLHQIIEIPLGRITFS
jgi:hypothetical protein